MGLFLQWHGGQRLVEGYVVFVCVSVIHFKMYISTPICIICKEKVQQTYDRVTGGATEARWTITHKHVESIQTGTTISTGVGLTLIYLGFTPAIQIMVVTLGKNINIIHKCELTGYIYKGNCPKNPSS